MVDESGGGGDSTAPPVTRRTRFRQRDARRKANRSARNRRYWASRKERLRKTAVWGYDGLVAALVTRRKALGWTQLELDDRAGFQSGYTAKLENWRGPQGRVAGSVTMPLWLQALGIGFLPVALVDGGTGKQLRVLDIIRPKLPLADHNRRIPRDEDKSK